MKKISKIFMCSIFLFLVVACSKPASSTQNLKDGTYTSSQVGFNGDINLEAKIENNQIIDLTIRGDNETESIGKAALEPLKESILNNQSSDIDLISGATITSKAVQKGISEILDEARGIEKSTSYNLKDGTYKSEVYSFATNKKLSLNLEVKDNKMTNIEVSDSGDTDIILNTAIENLIPQMLEYQSVKIDSISGATISSNAIKSATEDALIQALKAGNSSEDAIANFYSKPEKSTEEKTIETDILVVGLGGAGITTATRAAEAIYKANNNDASKVKVFGIDKAAKYGGTSVTTTSPMSINPSYFVSKNNNQEYVDAEVLKEDWLTYTENDAKEWAIDLMMEESGPAVDWLIENGFIFGEPIQGLSAPYKVCVNYGAQFAIPKSTVQTYFDSIMENYTKLGGDYLLQVEATDLIKNEDDEVVGVKAIGADGTSYTIKAKAVVLSTGGFGGNGEMQDKYLSNEYYNLAGGGRYNIFGMSQNDGKMIQSAIDNGAATYNIGMPPVSHIGGAYKIMHKFEVKETGDIDIWTNRPATQSLNDIPMMLAVAPNSLAVNRQGVRFTDETTLAAYGNWQAGAYYYTIYSDKQIKEIEEKGLKFDTIGLFVNQGGYPTNTPIPEIYDVLEEGIKMDYIYKADSIEELAKKINVDPTTLSTTISNYNTYMETRENPKDNIKKSEIIYSISGQPIEGDYETFEKVEGSSYYAIKGSPWIYSTVGALDVDENLQVLDTSGNPIKGLYAAGTDCLGILFTEKKEYVTYGGADQGWAFTSGYILGEKLGKQILEN